MLPVRSACGFGRGFIINLVSDIFHDFTKFIRVSFIIQN